MSERLVAILGRRGRFWVAEPLFPVARHPGPDRTRPQRRLTLSSNRLAGRGGGAAREGDIVLVGAQAPPRAGRRGGHDEGRGGRTARGAGRAQLLGVVGRPDVARHVIEALMLDRGLSRGFAPAVERDAREAVSAAGGRAAARRDLRGLPTFTIDPLSAKDFDDAISAERIDGGGVRVYVHIADVSAHVPEGSLLDREARRRAMSVYVPGAVEPMLPHALSDEACSLVPGRDRLALTVELEVRGEQVLSSAFHRSVIRSDERLDYDRVDRMFAGTERAAEPWGESLRAAREAAAALGSARMRRAGALTLDSPEPEFAFDAQGHVSEVAGRVQTESHRLIESLMIAANEAVAQLLERRGVPCLYRVHEQPKPEKVLRLVDQLASLGVPTPPVRSRLSPSQAKDLLGELAGGVESHIARAARRSLAGDSSIPPSGGRLALTALVLRSLEQAVYSPKNIGHSGLGSACYCHFTSPIRRYPDLVCHRALLSVIDGGAEPAAAGLRELGEWVSEREREAMVIERDADDIARCFALEAALYEDGWDAVFAGEVTGLISAGAFVAFGDPWPGAAGATTMPPYQGMLPVRRMRGEEGQREWWELNEQGTMLLGEGSGAVRLGGATSVRVTRVDTVRGRVDLAPAG